MYFRRTLAGVTHYLPTSTLYDPRQRVWVSKVLQMIIEDLATGVVVASEELEWKVLGGRGAEDRIVF